METILLLFITGSMTGFLLRGIMQGDSPSQLFCIIAGVAGAYIGYEVFLLYNIRVGDGLFTTITSAAVGAIAVTAALRILRIN